MNTSIIIPCYNRPKLLKLGLESLSKQDTYYPFEVIVLNDGLPDETEKICNEYKYKLNVRLRYIFTGQRNYSDKFIWRVPGFAINIGVKQAKGSIIILTCPEIYLMETDIIRRIIESLPDGSKSLVIPYGKFDEEGKILNAVENNQKIDFSLYDAIPRRLPTWLQFFMGMRKESFISIGGYDEDFVGYCFDDNDLIDRLRINGCEYCQLQRHIIHLFHLKNNRIGLENETKQFKYNENLYNERKHIVIRNKNREWGVIEADLEKQFTDVYKNNTWLRNKSKSGEGSDTDSTKTLKLELIKLINELKIDTLLDLGCGDFNWMKNIVPELNIKQYIGIDIVKHVIENNNEQYSSDKIEFIYANIINVKLPKADLILCRDVPVHLSFKLINNLLKNFNSSDFTYLLMTTFTNEDRKNKDIETKEGAWRPLNLQKEPFSFPTPISIINEQCKEYKELFIDKSLGLWKKGDINSD